MAAIAQHITATVLGCGSSGGVPRVGGNWGACDPENPKNNRRRCSLLISGTTPGQEGVTNIIVDTGCDLRMQLLDANVSQVSAVLYTHDHADHVHGIDDLRVLALTSRKRVDVFYCQKNAGRLRTAFSYCFEAPQGSPYPPILNANLIAPDQKLLIDGPGGSIPVQVYEQEHGSTTSLGFRVGNFAYSVDLSGIPDRSLDAVSGLDVWILDALRPTPHPSHLSLPQALDWVERMQPKQAVLTNLHTDLDYAETESITPFNVTPAYDGMVIDVSNGKVLR